MLDELDVQTTPFTNYGIHLPLGENPSFWHTTLASRASQKSSHMVPYMLSTQTSTLPSLWPTVGWVPFISRTLPLLQAEKNNIYEQSSTNITYSNYFWKSHIPDCPAYVHAQRFLGRCREPALSIANHQLITAHKQWFWTFKVLLNGYCHPLHIQKKLHPFFPYKFQLKGKTKVLGLCRTNLHDNGW